MNESIGPIPKLWRTTVALILRSGTAAQVIIRRRAIKDWQATFLEDFFEFTLRDTLADALEVEGIIGKRYEMDEPGETYGFIFEHRHIRLYGKINLIEADKMVIVYSAHRPLKGEEIL